MTTAVQRRRGTNTEHATFTGLDGEITVNTTTYTLHVHDGATVGGIVLAKADGSNIVTSSIDINGGTIDGTVIGGSSAAAGSFTTISASGEIAANGGVAFGDNDKATFGDSDDLQIYHDGSNSYIADTGTGVLALLATDLRIKNAANTKSYINGTDGGNVELYYDGGVKLSTTSTGIDVTGTVTADGLKVETSTTSAITISEDTGSGTAELRFVATDSFPKTKIVTDVSAGSLTLETLASDRLSIANNGDISFYEPTGTTAKFFWDASAESLGIGTSSPTAPLHVSGTANSIVSRFVGNTTDGTKIQFDQAGVANWRIGQVPNTDAFAFWGFGAGSYPERARIDSSGNVGIGRTTMDERLHIQNGNDAINFKASNASGGYATFGLDSAATSDGRITWTNALIFGASGTERMRIDASGNLLVGTTSANGRLTVNSGTAALMTSFTSTDTNGGYIYFASEGGGKGYIGTSYHLLTGTPTDDYFAIRGENGLDFAVSSTRCMRIDSSGYLLVGVTSSVNGGHEFKIGSGTVSTFTTNSTTATNMCVMRNGNGNVGSITTNGSATAYNTSSDYRLKENVVPMDNASDRVLALNPVRFNFIADPDKTVDGFLAHEAQEVVPEAVHGVKDGVDDEGNPVYQGIDQSKLVPLLTKALQEALERIAVLESKVGA